MINQEDVIPMGIDRRIQKTATLGNDDPNIKPMERMVRENGKWKHIDPSNINIESDTEGHESHYTDWINVSYAFGWYWGYQTQRFDSGV